MYLWRIMCQELNPNTTSVNRGQSVRKPSFWIFVGVVYNSITPKAPKKCAWAPLPVGENLIEKFEYDTELQGLPLFHPPSLSRGLRYKNPAAVWGLMLML